MADSDPLVIDPADNADSATSLNAVVERLASLERAMSTRPGTPHVFDTSYYTTRWALINAHQMP